MDRTSEAVHEALKRARRARGVTQVELARLLNCKQSAISMFEAGRAGVLAHKTVQAMADVLEVDIRPLEAPPADTAAVRWVLKYCPVDDCPANIPYVVRGVLCFRPRLVRAPVSEPSRCGLCGDILQDACPHTACGAPVEEGSHCRLCGTAYVAAAQVLRGPVEQWADAQRGRIRELREMTATLQYGA